MCVTRKEKASFKMADSDEFILWSLERSDNIMSTRKWYYKLDDSGYVVEMTNLNVKFSSKSIIKKSDKIQINSDAISSFSFYFSKDKRSKSDSIQYTKLIDFKSDMVEFSVNAFLFWKSIDNKEEKGVYIFDRKIPISPDYILRFNYSDRTKRFKIKIVNKPLCKSNFKNLFKEIKELRSIYFISLFIEDPYTALFFLNLWREFALMKSIELIIKMKCNVLQNYMIDKASSTLLRWGKRVKVVKHSIISVNYISLL